MIIAAITVTTRPDAVATRLIGDGQPSSGQAFWGSWPGRDRSGPTFSVGEEERRFRQRFQKTLGELLGRLVLPTKRSFRIYDDDANLDLLPVIAVRVGDIRYGSLKFDLDFPDVDGALELFGNSADVLAAILETYIPQAFYEAEDIRADQLQGLFTFDVNMAQPFVQYTAQKKAGEKKESPKGAVDAKARGALILGEMIRSPLIFPVLLVMFLWFVARQDMLAQRQMETDLIKTTLQQQTAVLTTLIESVLKKEPSGSNQPAVTPAEAGSKPKEK
jgi:hypothetical protein